MGLISEAIEVALDLFKKKRHQKPVLEILSQQPGDFMQPHQMLMLSLKNRDEDYAIILENISVESSGRLRIKVLQESALGSGSYPDPGRPFSASETVNMTLPSEQSRRFMILFSSAGRIAEVNDSIYLKVSYNRPAIFHKTARPTTFKIAVDTKAKARIQ